MTALAWGVVWLAGLAGGGLETLYAADAARLGAAGYRERERAARDLAAAWPWSWPAVERAARGADPEAAARARDLADRWRRRERAERPFLYYAVRFGTADPYELLGLHLILKPPAPGLRLPWADWADHTRYARYVEVRRGVVRAARRLGVYPAAAGLDLDPDRGWRPLPGCLGGLDDLRFAVRGLPGPSQALGPPPWGLGWKVPELEWAAAQIGFWR